MQDTLSGVQESKRRGRRLVVGKEEKKERKKVKKERREVRRKGRQKRHGQK